MISRNTTIAIVIAGFISMIGLIAIDSGSICEDIQTEITKETCYNSENFRKVIVVMIFVTFMFLVVFFQSLETTSAQTGYKHE